MVEPPFVGNTRDVVVIGASSGGLEALQELAASLPADFPGVLGVVIHTTSHGGWNIPTILDRAGPLPAVLAEDDMPLEPGRIHVARPDRHLLFEPGRLRTVLGPPENRHRPAIDPLFRSAAWAYGQRVAGVVLSGNLDDGTAGLWAIKSCGGVTVVQDPEDATYPEMPSNALLYNEVDHRLSATAIGELLARLAREPSAAPDFGAPATIGKEVAALSDLRQTPGAARLGALSPFTCPACGGALWEIEEGRHLRYRCHVGHAYSQDVLLDEQDLGVEEALYVALRSMQEKAVALRRLAERWPDRLPTVKLGYAERAQELDQSIDTLRSMLAGHRPSRRAAR